MHVLITGGGGFLGQAILERLLERGDQVTSLARGDYPALRALGAKTLQADLGADLSRLKAILPTVDALVHTAAKVGIWGDPKAFEAVNVQGTATLLQLAREAGVGRVVFTSSPSVTFGGHDSINAGPEEPYPDHYLSEYPRTKALAEQFVLAQNAPDFRTTSLRPHLIWGPGDPHLIPRLIERARAGKLRIVGDGTNMVDLTYIDNAAHAHILALDALDTGHVDRDEGPAGKAYFISNGEPVNLWEWINGVLGALGIEPVRKRISRKMAHRIGAMLETTWRTLGRPGEPPMTRFVAAQLATSHWYDMAPATRDFGYVPLVSMEEGMVRLLDTLSDPEGGLHV